LHGGDAALRMDKARDSCELFDVIITPDSEILRADTSFGENRSGFGAYHARAANGATTEVDEVPIVGKSIGA
jgi:hypothetical protein